jgi:ribonuclease BN (tRNA processing enzyme)
MRLTLLPSALPDTGEDQHQFLTSYVLNDTIAIDAGSLGIALSPAAQAQIKHIFISHSHIDHVGSLPVFIDNVNEMGGAGVSIYGSEAVLESLRRDIFNDRVWPDYNRLLGKSDVFFRLVRLEAGHTVELGKVRVTAVPVDHVVPTSGFIIQDPTAACVITSDTGPTEAIWKQANQTPNLKAVFLEVTFPNALATLAEASKHLTPALFAKEIAKLNRPVPVIAVHLKARFRAQLVEELQALGLANVQIGKFGTPYDLH